MFENKENICVGVIGLGYVGLPLALAFGKEMKTIGFDLDGKKVARLKKFIDSTGECVERDFIEAVFLSFTSDESVLNDVDIFIVAVPTPIDEEKSPDLSNLTSAMNLLSRLIKPGVVVVIESTVYPGVTEEVCVPILEKFSQLRWKEDFFVGYSPERVNPGDRERRLRNILKVVSGDSERTTQFLFELYSKIIDAGVYAAPSIKVAEAAKVIENTQRDVNIGLINEFALIFDKLGLSTKEVLDTAATKWNFLNFQPGLVGGHCIGVDPYYLTHKAKEVGLDPEIALAGRKLNDKMGAFVVGKLFALLSASNKIFSQSRVAVLGITFKENCPDIRNSQIPDMIEKLSVAGIELVVVDPVANVDDVRHEFGVKLVPLDEVDKCDAMIIAVPHQQFVNMSDEVIRSKLFEGGILMDLKSLFYGRNLETLIYWSL